MGDWWGWRENLKVAPKLPCVVQGNLGGNNQVPLGMGMPFCW